MQVIRKGVTFMTENNLYKHSDSRDMNLHYQMFESETVRQWEEEARQSVFSMSAKNPYALNLQNEWVKEQFENFRHTYGISIPSDTERMMFEKRTTDYFLENGAEGNVPFPKETSRRRQISDEELAKIG